MDNLKLKIICKEYRILDKKVLSNEEYKRIKEIKRKEEKRWKQIKAMHNLYI